jgi:hypothetical protein
VDGGSHLPKDFAPIGGESGQVVVDGGCGLGHLVIVTMASTLDQVGAMRD